MVSVSFQIVKKIKAHRGGVTKVILNPYHDNQLISTGLDGVLKLWQLPKIVEQNRIKLPTSQITAIIGLSTEKVRGFLASTGNGTLLILNQFFQVQEKYRLHQQCISEIVITQQNVVTLSYDGDVKFLNKGSLAVQNIIHFQTPLLSATEYNGLLYIASQKSFIVNLQTKLCKEIKRFDCFAVGNNTIFGCSQDKGLTCLSKNSNTYVPTEYVIPYKRKILVFSEKSICVFNHFQTMSWKSKRYNEMSTGESMKSGVSVGSYIYVGGDQGNLYCIKDVSPQYQDV